MLVCGVVKVACGGAGQSLLPARVLGNMPYSAPHTLSKPANPAFVGCNPFKSDSFHFYSPIFTFALLQKQKSDTGCLIQSVDILSANFHVFSQSQF